MLYRMGSLVPWLLGFFSIVNVYLLPALQQSPRATDVLGLVLSVWLLWRFTITGVRSEPFLALVVFGIPPLLWGLYAFSVGDTASVLTSTRWLLAIPWGYALFVIVRDPRQRVS